MGANTVAHQRGSLHAQFAGRCGGDLEVARKGDMRPAARQHAIVFDGNQRWCKIKHALLRTETNMADSAYREQSELGPIGPGQPGHLLVLAQSDQAPCERTLPCGAVVRCAPHKTRRKRATYIQRTVLSRSVRRVGGGASSEAVHGVRVRACRCVHVRACACVCVCVCVCVCGGYGGPRPW